MLNKVDLLILSLDGTEEIHDFLRRKKGSYKKVIDSIKTAKKNGIPVLVNTTVMNTNADNLKELSKVLKDLEVFWTIDLFNDLDIVKDWQHGSNISRPTNKLLEEVVKIGKENPYLSNSFNYLNSVKERDLEKDLIARRTTRRDDDDARGGEWECLARRRDEENGAREEKEKETPTVQRKRNARAEREIHPRDGAKHSKTERFAR